MNVLAHLDAFEGKKILVLGDIMLDTYINGTVTRISPEAPVPIVLVSDERAVLGGAANVALNIASLGGRPELFGVIGDDLAGRTLAMLLTGSELSESGLCIDPNRPTTRKVRVCAHGQQLVRYDEESTTQIS